MQATQKKVPILSDFERSEACDSVISQNEKSDEFLRNFFIKFGMKKTLDQFSTEWYELKAMGELDIS